MLELKSVLTTDQLLKDIELEDGRLNSLYHDVLQVNTKLDRTLVSFQANKTKNQNRWCKYKEGFSYDLVLYALQNFGVNQGKVLDPFAGSGTTLFVASDLGIDSVGIELLPNGIELIKARELLRNGNSEQIVKGLSEFRDSSIWKSEGESKPFNHLRITNGAFPPENEAELGRYLFEIEKISDASLKRILSFAVMCILEDISYTRKDGQYLRWDTRSGRCWGKKPFSKGTISQFTPTIRTKINEIINDITQEQLSLLEPIKTQNFGKIDLLTGSCLDILPSLESHQFNFIMTSPPYCNRYDYTRTYALELAMLGVDESELKSLRQTMLSCTVENKEKQGLSANFEQDRFQKAIETFESQKLLSYIRAYLNQCQREGLLNNDGIPRLVHNYFKELTLVIFECARLLKPNSRFVMVNDNVRYQGVHVPVDLILSDIAQSAGFEVEKIWVLPIGKGNSSQQMRLHGRQELRKCVYIWRR